MYAIIASSPSWNAGDVCRRDTLVIGGDMYVGHINMPSRHWAAAAVVADLQVHIRH